MALGLQCFLPFKKIKNYIYEFQKNSKLIMVTVNVVSHMRAKFQSKFFTFWATQKGKM